MSDVIHRTTLELKLSVNTQDFPTGTWIINPDLSALGGVAEKYWKIVVDAVLEMTQVEKDAVDAAETQAAIDSKETIVKNAILPEAGLIASVLAASSASGLVITSAATNLGLNDTATVVADTTLTKFVIIKLIYNSTSDSFSIQSFEKTDGDYSDLAADETLTANIKEYSVVANGTDLVEV